MMTDKIQFKLLKEPRFLYQQWGDGLRAARYTTDKGDLVAVHYCPCHDFQPYTASELMTLIEKGLAVHVICCFPAHAKRRHPALAPYILGDWEGVTLSEAKYCECCDSALALSEDHEETKRFQIYKALGYDHLAGEFPMWQGTEAA